MALSGLNGSTILMQKTTPNSLADTARKETPVPNTKRKKGEKEYSYYEYLKKFRPKSLPKENEEKKEEPFDCLTKMAIDKVREGLETSPPRATRK